MNRILLEALNLNLLSIYNYYRAPITRSISFLYLNWDIVRWYWLARGIIYKSVLPINIISYSVFFMLWFSNFFNLHLFSILWNMFISIYTALYFMCNGLLLYPTDSRLCNIDIIICWTIYIAPSVGENLTRQAFILCLCLASVKLWEKEAQKTYKIFTYLLRYEQYNIKRIVNV